MFLSILMRGIQMIPAIVHGIEAVFGAGNGKTKQEQALSVSALVFKTTEFIASKDIVDDEAFLQGQKEMMDAIVKMFNASIWSKNKA